jgi:signal transduction histidine kinase
LAIVKAIAEAHRGRVEIDSRPGKGATFTVVIPVGWGAEARSRVS